MEARNGTSNHAVCDILDELSDTTSEQRRVSVDCLVEAFGHRGTGALLFVPAVMEMSPIGGIPGVPTTLALIVLLFAAQIVLGRSHMWLPGFLGERTLAARRVERAVEAMRPLAARLDRWFHGRMTWLVTGIAPRVAAVLCMLLTLTVPPLELVPFASSAPMAAIAAFGLALLVRDGALMVLASVLSVVALVVLVNVVLR